MLCFNIFVRNYLKVKGGKERLIWVCVGQILRSTNFLSRKELFRVLKWKLDTQKLRGWTQLLPWGFKSRCGTSASA